MEDGFELEDWLELASALITLVLFAVMLLAYRRRPTARGALLAGGFGAFALRGACVVAADIVGPSPPADVLAALAIPLELTFLLLVVAAFFKA